jgi:hypothetical protein
MAPNTILSVKTASQVAHPWVVAAHLQPGATSQDHWAGAAGQHGPAHVAEVSGTIIWTLATHPTHTQHTQTDCSTFTLGMWLFHALRRQPANGSQCWVMAALHRDGCQEVVATLRIRVLIKLDVIFILQLCLHNANWSCANLHA